jgi:hypothetical protein
MTSLCRAGCVAAMIRSIGTPCVTVPVAQSIVASVGVRILPSSGCARAGEEHQRQVGTCSALLQLHQCTLETCAVEVEAAGRGANDEFVPLTDGAQIL